MNGEALLVRRYEPGDEEVGWRLHNDALHDVGAHLGNGSWDDDLRRVQTAYPESGGEFLVGVRGDRVVAMGALRRVSSEEAEVKRLRVAPGLQGRGFGQAMLDALELRAAELGYAALRLDTTVQQRVARGLYQKNGYREARRGQIGLFDWIFYEKGLAR